MDIPSVPFSPSLLLIDSTIPKAVRREIVKRLEEYHFAVCAVEQTDGLMLYEIQKLFDSKKHAILFVNRGMHALARATFLAMFEATLSGSSDFGTFLFNVY